MITIYKSFGFNCLAFAQFLKPTQICDVYFFFTEKGMEFRPKSIQIFLVLLEFTKEVI